MADRETIEQGIKACWSEYFSHRCFDCPYVSDRNDKKCIERLGADVIAMLKEQDAKWVEDKQGEVCRLIKCSNCGLTFIVGNNIPYDEWIEDRNYCRRCGARMVKRND